MKMEDYFIGKRTGNKCHLKWYSRKLGLKTIQNQYFFSLQTQRLAESFERLNSYLEQSTGELWSCNVA